MYMMDLVEDHWPDLQQVHRRSVHLLIRGVIGPVSVVATVGVEQQSSTLQREDQVIDIVSRFKKSWIEYFSSLNDSSAAAANPDRFAEQQWGKNYMLNGRPHTHTGPPIVLYHPVFGNFLTNLKSSNQLSPKFHDSIFEYFWASQRIYHAEAGSRASNQDENTRTILEDLLGKLWRVTEDGPNPDAVTIGSNGGACLFIEMKDEIGTGGSDPSIQTAYSYSRFWRNSQLKDRCCCPSILIAIAGPWMCVLGAVLLDRPVVQPMTDYIWVGINPSRPLDVVSVARVFDSILMARKELEVYYAKLTSTSSMDSLNPKPFVAPFFPYPNHFIGEGGNRIKFTYKGYLNRLSVKNLQLGPSKSQLIPSKLVFLAECFGTDPTTSIVVKFVESYNANAHKLLAEAGLAPQLLYDGVANANENVQLGPDYRMIVMEYIAGVDLGRYTGSTLPRCVSADVDRAVSLLHNSNFVFGDPRPPNVMLVKDVAGAVVGAKLIDFDWCGKHQEERYPFSMNTEIDWASGVGPGALLDKVHDIDMKNRLFALYEVDNTGSHG
ncbi:Tyrosine kinase specific for activated [Rhizoctonia solani]|uniref:Tyrosine kinase specific for activated n=1 Tax=Rhizoctonia solani TaxID=456999 RepID=A0A8H8NQ98_9AGAM|nr:Tyrosine kinase specific for activated [Rhizoctonia solani]QRW17485.1 Tyrosine kinase specific for activated [Rhizoctonia solani]